MTLPAGAAPDADCLWLGADGTTAISIALVAQVCRNRATVYQELHDEEGADDVDRAITAGIAYELHDLADHLDTLGIETVTEGPR